MGVLKYYRHEDGDYHQFQLIDTDAERPTHAVHIRLVEEARKVFPNLDAEEVFPAVYNIPGVKSDAPGIEFAFGEEEKIECPQGYVEGFAREV